MGAASQTAFAGTKGGGGGNNAPSPDYDGDDGLSAGEIALIAGGGAVAVVGGLAAAGVFGAGPAAGVVNPPFPIGAPHDCDERYEQLPAGATNVSAIRLVPQASTLDAGWCRCYHLEVKSDGKWYSVTHRPDAIIQEVDDVRTPLIKQDGTKNVFCLPISASQTANGQSTLLEGIFSCRTVRRCGPRRAW